MSMAGNSSNNFIEQVGKNDPLNGINVGSRATPKLVDFDGDGDLDVFVGAEAGSISFFENIGSAVQPEFVERTGAANPFNDLVITEAFSNPTLADLDGDGQIDTAVVGNLAGTLKYFSYDGSQFIEQTGHANPLEGVTVAVLSAPEFVDLNGDGQFDLVVGDSDGKLTFFRNDGNGFTQQTSRDNPLDGIDVGNGIFTPTFQDIDGDGDLDAFVSEFFAGTIRYLENTGTATAPQFEERIGVDNPLEGTRIVGSAPTLGDLDGDGDFDAIMGGIDGALNYFVNAPSVSLSTGRGAPSETGAVGAFIVTSSVAAPEGGLTIEYTVESSEYTAAEGVDYQPLSGQVTIAAGETTATIEVVPRDDQAFDPLETVTLTISPPAGYAVPVGEATAYLAIADNEGNALLAEILNEPNFKDQWHLWNTPYNLGTDGVDLNLLEVWQDYSGNGIKVGIVDSGVDNDHPDLAANYNPSPNPDEMGKYSVGHGTAVAGIVAAEAGNGLGGAGIAYESDITSYYLPFEERDRGEISDEEFTQSIEDDLNAQIAMDVSNNSWSARSFSSDFRDPTSHAGDIIQAVVAQGRDGLGTVYVFAAGNERAFGESANYSNLANSRHTIAVAALTADGVHTSYSNPGANLLISAFGSEPSAVFSTDIFGGAGYSPGDYTFTFDGTSAAAPMVSGVVALMLAANPNLGYRDVQEILAYSARWNDADNESWIINGANNWNGGGLRHSSDYGFGLIDALAAVRLAETWQTQHTAANEQQVSHTSASTLAIPDDDPAGISDTIRVRKGLKLDYVEVDLTINHANYSDLIVTLTSPTGVVSELINRVPQGNDTQFGYNTLRTDIDGQDFTYTFSTTANWGETGIGDWKLTVKDAKTGDIGTLNNWTLNLYGDALTPDNTYIYTNEFSNAKLNDEATRQQLSDLNGGQDTLNAAAVASDLELDLTPGETSHIAGKTLHIETDTLIEHAFGGDGDDQIVGNSADNTLHGGRGDDTVAGGFGSDILHGNAGDDILRGDRNRRSTGGLKGGDDILYGGTGNDAIAGKGGDDTLYGDGGNDRLYGDAGHDWLTGGAGEDVLTGGGGRDIFALAVDQGIDIITDFKIDKDLIELLGGISFGQTSRMQRQQDTLLTFENQTLALLQGVAADELTADSFLVG